MFSYRKPLPTQLMLPPLTPSLQITAPPARPETQCTDPSPREASHDHEPEHPPLDTQR